MLAGEVHDGPARDQHGKCRAGRKQLGDEGRRLQHVLEGVEDEERPALGEEGRQRLFGRAIADVPHAEGLRDGASDQARVANRGERHEPDTVRERLANRLRHPDGQPCLADPTGAGQSDKRDVITEQKGANGGHLVRSSDQWRERAWQNGCRQRYPAC